jgi:hypothetical protein
MFLSSLGSGDPIRPSFFEMLAQKEMMGALMPAVKWIFAVSTENDSIIIGEKEGVLSSTKCKHF